MLSQTKTHGKAHDERLTHFLPPALDEAVPQFGGLVEVGRWRDVRGPGEVELGVDLLLRQLLVAVLALGQVLLRGGCGGGPGRLFTCKRRKKNFNA